jgi:hypothetical protein
VLNAVLVSPTQIPSGNDKAIEIPVRDKAIEIPGRDKAIEGSNVSPVRPSAEGLFFAKK